MKANIKDSQVTVLLEVDGEICLVAFKKENLKLVQFTVKAAAEMVAKTGKTQAELNEFLGYER